MPLPPALLSILFSLALTSCAFAPVDALETARRQHAQLQLPLPATMPAANMRLPFFTRLMARAMIAITSAHALHNTGCASLSTWPATIII